VVQTLFVQVRPVAHTVPQAPQFLRSEVVLAQVPLHRVGMNVGHAQTRFWQV
jgi:hypothetical protein